jgi:hypothetical protein
MSLWLRRCTDLLKVIVGENLGVDVTEDQKRGRWPWGRVLKIILGQPQALTFPGESTMPSYEPWSSSIERGIFSNVIKCHTKITLSMRQVEDLVCPVLARRVPTICVLLSTLFQERVSNFVVNMMLLHATITEKNMRINVLESSVLTKPEDLVMYKSVLNRGTNSVQFI